MVIPSEIFNRIIFLSGIFLSNIVYCQSSGDRYLLYEKNIRTSIDRHTKELKIDTVLEVSDFIWKRGSKWFTSGVVFLHSPWGIRIEMKTEGEKAFFSFEDNYVEGIILKDSLLKMPKSKFALVPLRKGVKVGPFKDRLWKDQRSVWKILFDRKDLGRRGKLTTQESCAIIPYDSSVSILQCGKMIYSGEEQNNVIVSESLFAVIQVARISKLKVETNLYPWSIEVGGIIVSRNDYMIEPFPDNSVVTEVQNRLVGDWWSTKISQFGSSDLEPLPYAFDFHFLKNELIIKKDYKGLKFKNRTDTLIYKLNPTADYFIIDRQKSKTKVSQLLIHKRESNTLSLVLDEIWVTEDASEIKPVKF